MNVGQRTYGDFLHLPQLLAGLTPGSPRDNGRVYAAEHFFLVAHQASELWLKHVLLDLEEALATVSGPRRNADQAAEHTRRSRTGRSRSSAAIERCSPSKTKSS